jgi:tetratricopeptide (TPR) repeat protein
MTTAATATGPQSKNEHWRALTICVVLAFGTLLAFFGVWRNGFVDYDDNSYVFLNPMIRRGLGWPTLVWSCTFVNIGHWIPLTWLSFALDYQIYGLDPAGFHITNLVLHSANVILLFTILHVMTGSLWRSAAVSALFGVHPLRVESVAWVTERKDVLSGFFFMLTLLAYTLYVRNCASSEVKRRVVTSSRMCLWASGVFLALGLMSKSMLVTVPFVLLLLDFWPFGRLGGARGMDGEPAPRHRLLLSAVREKLPLFALALVACAATFLTQESEKATNAALRIPVENRLANAAVTTITYLWQTFWPRDLSVFYPPKAIGLLAPPVLAALFFLLILTFGALIARGKLPFLLVGWFWFVGMLVPVIGIVQGGDFIQADRYTYLPSIGLLIALVWGLGRLVLAGPKLKLLIPALLIASVVALGFATHAQVAVWRNTRTLFTHAASVTQSNHVALTMIAGLDLKEGKVNEAITNLTRVLEFAPKYPSAEYHLGEALQMQGRMVEAIPHLEAAVGPDVAVAGRARLVLSLIDAGRLPDAETALESLLAAIPGQPDLLIMKAALLNEQGRSDEASELFRPVTATYAPALADNPRLNFEIGELYSLVGENRKATRFFEKAIETSPDFVNALNDSAWILATDPDPQVRNGARAVELAERACKATEWKQPVIIGTLGAAYAEAGQFDKAIKTAEKARDLAKQEQLERIVAKNEELLKLYKEGKPYREGGKQ